MTLANRLLACVHICLDNLVAVRDLQRIDPSEAHAEAVAYWLAQTRICQQDAWDAVATEARGEVQP